MKYKLVCFDLDGTLVNNITSIWQAIHEALETDNKLRKEVMQKFFDGKISYKEWAKHDVQVWIKHGLTKTMLQEIVQELKVTNGAHELLASLKEHGIKLAVISGSLKIVLDEKFSEDFDYIYINKLIFDGDKVIGVRPTVYDQEGKATALREICEKEGIDISETAFIGDHNNDTDIAKAAGLSIAFNCASDKLRSVADIEVKGNDLKDILPLILRNT